MITGGRGGVLPGCSTLKIEIVKKNCRHEGIKIFAIYSSAEMIHKKRLMSNTGKVLKIKLRSSQTLLK
jgi:hypothetical protein